MSTKNETIQKSIEKNKKVFTALRRSDIVLQFKQCMVSKGVRSIDLAERLGVSEPNVSRWLKGDQNLKLDTLYLIADALEERLTLSVGLAVQEVAVDLHREERKTWSRIELTNDAKVIPIDTYRDRIVMGKRSSFRTARSRTNIGINGEENELATASA